MTDVLGVDAVIRAQTPYQLLVVEAVVLDLGVDEVFDAVPDEATLDMANGAPGQAKPSQAGRRGKPNQAKSQNLGRYGYGRRRRRWWWWLRWWWCVCVLLDVRVLLE